MCIKFNALAKIEDIKLEDITRENVYPVPKNKISLHKKKIFKLSRMSLIAEIIPTMTYQYMDIKI